MHTVPREAVATHNTPIRLSFLIVPRSMRENRQSGRIFHIKNPSIVESDVAFRVIGANKWAFGMHEYFVYMIGVDGRLHGAIQLVCADDESAKALASQLVVGQNVELWREEHLVAKLMASGIRAAAVN